MAAQHSLLVRRRVGRRAAAAALELFKKPHRRRPIAVAGGLNERERGGRMGTVTGKGGRGEGDWTAHYIRPRNPTKFKHPPALALRPSSCSEQPGFRPSRMHAPAAGRSETADGFPYLVPRRRQTSGSWSHAVHQGGGGRSPTYSTFLSSSQGGRSTRHDWLLSLLPSCQMGVSNES